MKTIRNLMSGLAFLSTTSLVDETFKTEWWKGNMCQIRSVVEPSLKRKVGIFGFGLHMGVMWRIPLLDMWYIYVYSYLYHGRCLILLLEHGMLRHIFNIYDCKYDYHCESTHLWS